MPDVNMSDDSIENFDPLDYWKWNQQGFLVPATETEQIPGIAYVTNEWVMNHLDQVPYIENPSAQGYWEDGPNGYVLTEDEEQIPGKRYYASV